MIEYKNMNYDFRKIEKKWQARWAREKIYETKEDPKKDKFYCLIEFPYPSGEGLHVGHPRSYTALDIVARKKRMEGKNVLYPIGWDAFGLPTESYAIKTGIQPAVATEKNIKNFTRQLKSLGFSFDWSREINTTDPKYYKWTQWMFLQFFKHGLAYKAKVAINWCPKCKIGLANEEVVNGACERCGGKVERRMKEQWMLKITKYAERLLEGLKKVDYTPQIKEQQINWIGKSEGAEVDFKIKNSKLKIKVFTTRPDTLFGATYLVLAPEHELVALLLKIKNQKSKIKNIKEAAKYIEQAKRKSDLERQELKEKTGVELKGIKAINPTSNKEISIWLADYVLIGYGTGAIMAVPAHDQRDYDFATKYKLPIVEVVQAPEDVSGKLKIKNEKLQRKIKNFKRKRAYEGDGIAVNSGFLDGLPTAEAKEKIIKWLEEKHIGKRAVNYKLRDWVFSRQRYWGEPIPLVFCPACKKQAENQKSEFRNPKLSEGEILNAGWVPVEEKDLPVELPKIKKYEPIDTGESPLAAIENWVKTKCPKCGGPARRETDTMPNWAGSSWYFLRYTDPKNNKEFANAKNLKYWMPVDWYNGGMEHTTLHLLYSRFWYKFLYDIGVIPKECGDEPYKKRTSHGLILGKGGEKMSKSRGNVVNPDDVVARFGADTMRVYEMFMGPFEQAIPWDEKGVVGVYRFLERVWRLQEKLKIQNAKLKVTIKNEKLERLVHQTIKKVGEDIEQMKFNTAVSALMILTNAMAEQKELSIAHYQLLITLLAPFAPHIAEELWEKFGNKKSVHLEKWPEYDPGLVAEEEIDLVIQVNGKVRDTIRVRADIGEDEAKKVAAESEKVKKWIEGKEIRKVIFVKGRLVNIVV